MVFSIWNLNIVEYKYCVNHESISAEPMLLFANVCCRNFFEYDCHDEFCDQIHKIYVVIVLQISFDFLYIDNIMF
jgi:hypothetical protein